MHRFTVLLLGLLVTLPSPAAPVAAPPGPLRFVGGNLDLNHGGRVVVRFDEPGMVVLESKRGDPVRISTDKLSVVFDVTRTRPAGEVLGSYFSPASLGPSFYDDGGLLLAPVVLLVAAALAPVKDDDRYVTLAWRDASDTLHEVQLKMPDAEARTWISAFEAAMGRPVLDLPAERDRLRAELERRKDERIILELDRPASGLSRGSYSLLVLDGDEGDAEAYLFRGSSVDPAKAAASLRVAVEATPDGPAQPEPVFAPAARGERLAGVRLADRTLLFRGAGGIATLASDATRKPGTVVFQGATGVRFVIERADREGVPALATTALLEPPQGGRSTIGRLTVTRERLIFEADDPASSGAALDLPRSAIASVEMRGTKSLPKLALETPGGRRSLSVAIDGKGLTIRLDANDISHGFAAAQLCAIEFVALALRDFETALALVDAR